MTDRLYTYQDVAGIMKVHVKTVYRAFSKRKKFKHGNTVRITDSELQKFFDDHSHAKAHA